MDWFRCQGSVCPAFSKCMEQINLTTRVVPILSPQKRTVSFTPEPSWQPWTRPCPHLPLHFFPFTRGQMIISNAFSQRRWWPGLVGEWVGCVWCACCKANFTQPGGFLLSQVSMQTPKGRLLQLNTEKQINEQWQKHGGKSYQYHTSLSNNPEQGSSISECKVSQ